MTGPGPESQAGRDPSAAAGSVPAPIDVTPIVDGMQRLGDEVQGVALGVDTIATSVDELAQQHLLAAQEAQAAALEAKAAADRAEQIAAAQLNVLTSIAGPRRTPEDFGPQAVDPTLVLTTEEQNVSKIVAQAYYLAAHHNAGTLTTEYLASKLGLPKIDDGDFRAINDRKEFLAEVMLELADRHHLIPEAKFAEMGVTDQTDPVQKELLALDYIKQYGLTYTRHSFGHDGAGAAATREWISTLAKHQPSAHLLARYRGAGSPNVGGEPGVEMKKPEKTILAAVRDRLDDPTIESPHLKVTQAALKSLADRAWGDIEMTGDRRSITTGTRRKHAIAPTDVRRRRFWERKGQRAIADGLIGKTDAQTEQNIDVWNDSLTALTSDVIDAGGLRKFAIAYMQENVDYKKGFLNTRTGRRAVERFASSLGNALPKDELKRINDAAPDYSRAKRMLLAAKQGWNQSIAEDRKGRADYYESQAGKVDGLRAAADVERAYQTNMVKWIGDEANRDKTGDKLINKVTSKLSVGSANLQVSLSQIKEQTMERRAKKFEKRGTKVAPLKAAADKNLVDAQEIKQDRIKAKETVAAVHDEVAQGYAEQATAMKLQLETPVVLMKAEKPKRGIGRLLYGARRGYLQTQAQEYKNRAAWARKGPGLK